MFTYTRPVRIKPFSESSEMGAAPDTPRIQAAVRRPVANVPLTVPLGDCAALALGGSNHETTPPFVPAGAMWMCAMVTPVNPVTAIV
jgi:hypothetical protein